MNVKNFVPFVVEQTERGERSYDIYSRLLEERIVMLSTAINDDVANSIIAQLLYLDSKGPEEPIWLYINSPGGVVTSGLAIYDTMQAVRAKVNTICIGQAASMGAVLLAAGADGCRGSLPNSRIMIHQPLGGAEGQATDMRIQMQEMNRLEDALYNILAKHTKQPLDKIRIDCNRNNYMGAEEAIKYGLIDRVYTKIGAK